MNIQELFLNATEAYEEEGHFDLSQDDFNSVMNRLTELNRVRLNDKQKMEAKGIGAILFYANKTSEVDTRFFSPKLLECFKSIEEEFKGKTEG